MVFQKDIKDGAYPVRLTLVGWVGRNRDFSDY
jgi:hypothetical protein